ncbi:glycosyltransferase [Nocardioides pantholopis]|uniref:glycosyltransferase n=1 Tax=Nocardioides pantholopis TaxID=2483798 RepID=UPI000F081A79
MRALVNGYGAYAGGIVRVHNSVTQELAKYYDVYVANAPRLHEADHRTTVLSTQTDSRLASFFRDLLAARTISRYDVRIDTAPGLRFFTRARKRYVIVHDLNFLDPKVHGISWRQVVYRQLLHRWALPRCDHIVVVSEETRKELVSLVPSAETKTLVLPLPVDHLAPYFRPRPRTKDPKRTAVRLMSFGHAQNKGVRSLLRAMEAEQGWTLDLVCPGQAWDQYWRDEAELTGTIDRVTVHSHIDDIRLVQLYEQADVFCMLSSYEGYGLPVAEALSLGLPVITSNIATLAATGRGYAISVDPADPSAVRAAVRTARSMSGDHWERAQREFSDWTWEQWTLRLLQGTTQ